MISLTTPPTANSVPSPEASFLIYCGREYEKFTLKEVGKGKAREFFSIVDAIKYARVLRPDGGARFTVLNAHGAVTMGGFV